MKLSNQALGAIMMALQKSLLEQSDIVPTLRGFDFSVSEGEELVVSNPPNFTIDRCDNAEVSKSEKVKTVGSD